MCPLRQSGRKSAPLLGEGTEKICITGTISNSQRIPTKINENGVIAKVRIIVKAVIL